MAVKTSDPSLIWEFLNEHLTKDEKDVMAEECRCTLSTIYNYLGGKHSNYLMEVGIMTSGIKQLELRGIIFNDF